MARKKVIDTPEFKNAVEAAVAAAMSGTVDKLAALSGDAAPASSGNAADQLALILDKLSINLQALNNQGVRNKPLSPAELQKRENAQERLIDLLATARALPQAEWPKYQLIAKAYISERLIEPFYKRDSKGPAVRTEIAYTGVPNDAMVPVDDSAKLIFNAWRETTGGQTVLVPTADNRPLHVTAAGLVVRGDPPKRSTMAAPAEEAEGILALSNDHTQPEVAVLGTVAKKARTNALTGQQ